MDYVGGYCAVLDMTAMCQLVSTWSHFGVECTQKIYYIKLNCVIDDTFQDNKMYIWILNNWIWYIIIELFKEVQCL